MPDSKNIQNLRHKKMFFLMGYFILYELPEKIKSDKGDLYEKSLKLNTARHEKIQLKRT